MARSIEERFWSKVDKRGPDECWEWTACRAKAGYGDFGAGRGPDGKHRNIGAHRLSYELHHGPVPAGMFVCHRCDNPPCVNPAHLFAGTPRDNMRDMHGKGRAKHNPRCGEDNKKAKLTVEQVIEIRRAAKARKELASQFGVTVALVGMIQNGKGWEGIGPEPKKPNPYVRLESIAPEKVEAIRTTRLSQREASEKFGVAIWHVAKIRAGASGLGK